MIPQTVSIADIARVLALSEATVRHWVRDRRWPNGRPIIGLKLSTSPAADIRILKSNTMDYFRDCARDFSPESAETFAAEVGKSLRPKLSARDRRRQEREVTALRQMRQRKPAAT